MNNFIINIIIIQVWTIPSSSVFIIWSVYSSTTVLVLMYVVIVTQLLNSVSFMITEYKDKDGGGGWYRFFWTFYECVLVAVVLFTLFAVIGRWILMEGAALRYAESPETAYVDSVMDMCRVHDHITALASVTVAMMLFRLYRVVKYTSYTSYVDRTLHESGDTVAVVAALALTVAYGAWYGDGGHAFLNVFLFGQYAHRDRGLRWSPYTAVAAVAAMHSVLYATIIAVVTRLYMVITRVNTRKLNNTPST